MMTQKAYAEYKGFSRQYVNELVRDKVLRLKRGKIDRDEADMVLEARREPARPLRRQTEEPQDEIEIISEPVKSSPSRADLPELLLKTRIKSEAEKVKLLEIKTKVESGKYIDRDEAEARIYNHFRPIRDGLLTIPDRLDAELAASTDRHIVHKILYNEIVRVLDDANKPVFKKKR
ncbi:MAG: hypothetical protein H6864_00045 [Micavibrio sp.]|nr:hypothetical protein [Micavibrio sp.]